MEERFYKAEALINGYREDDKNYDELMYAYRQHLIDTGAYGSISEVDDGFTVFQVEYMIESGNYTKEEEELLYDYAKECD